MSCGAPERMTRAAPSPLRGRLRCAPAFAAPGAASNRHFETSGVRIPRPVRVAEPSALQLRSCPVAPRRGFEPLTHGLEGRCSIRLSYRGRIFRPAFGLQPAACSADRGFESSRPRPRGPLTRSGPPVRTGRGRGIRTPDILLPKQARYQTALYPALPAAPVCRAARAQMIRPPPARVNAGWRRSRLWLRRAACENCRLSGYPGTGFET